MILTLFFCAARIGEVVALRRQDVRFSAEGGAIITIRKHEGRVTASYSEKGGTRRLSSPKGRGRTGPKARRSVYVPETFAKFLRVYLDEHVGAADDARLFTGARGGWLDPGLFRRTTWATVLGLAFEEGHRLLVMTPHDLRHGGMTMWLRSRVPLKLCQVWGGWYSLKVMLDTYAAVLPDDVELGIAALENRLGSGVEGLDDVA